MKKAKEDGSDVIDFSDVVPTICDACKILPDHLKVRNYNLSLDQMLMCETTWWN